MIFTAIVLVCVVWFIVVWALTSWAANRIYLHICAQFHVSVNKREKQVRLIHQLSVVCWVLLGPGPCVVLYYSLIDSFSCTML